MMKSTVTNLNLPVLERSRGDLSKGALECIVVYAECECCVRIDV